MTTLEDSLGSELWCSVVIATYNRQTLLRQLLTQLDAQTLPGHRYEVIAVDDGSAENTVEALSDLKTRYALRVERQKNAGAAAARTRGAEVARGAILVIIDDDMAIGPLFLEAHLARHRGSKNTVVLGRLRPDAGLAKMPLFERFYARVLAKKAEAFASGSAAVRGHDLYTGNLSLPRELFLAVGGFDTSLRALEDEELGIRLEKAGARFVFANEAESVHGSDWTSMTAWLARAHRDGVYQTKVARKHADYPDASPWRHLPNLNPISRPFMALSLAAPAPARALANAAIRTAARLDNVGLEPLALAGATFVYGLQYYRGVGEETGSVANSAKAYRQFTQGVALLKRGRHGHASAWHTLNDAVREDHRMMHAYASRYDARGREAAKSQAPREPAIAADALKKIGFQLMIAYRVMRFFRQSDLGLGAQLMSRAIRHAFASDIHWDAEMEPGVVIVHGFGLAISYAAKVSAGCILFQNVTLGYGNDAQTSKAGAPHLESRVHVGIGATLYGPIVIGESTKIMAGCVVGKNIPAFSIVEAQVPNVAQRAAAHARPNRVS